MIMSPQIEIQYQRPKLYPKQETAIFNPARYSLIEASTKTGKTTGCLAWLFEQALFLGAPGRNFWWIAPIYPQAVIAFRRMKRAIPSTLYKSNESEHTITLPNGAVIWFKGADKPDSLYAEDVWAAVMDEASRTKEEAWHAIRSTITFTRGRVRFIGNVKGRKNWFYRMSRLAENGEPNMHYAKLIAYDAVEAGVLAASEVEDAKRILPENVFKELYLAEPSDDGGNPFGYAAIQRCIKPMSDLDPTVWGWDLAKSVDWTVGIGLDKNGQTSRFERFQRPWPVTITSIRTATGNVDALYDSTGVGDPVGEILQLDTGNYEGFKFTSQSKQQLMEGLAVAIQTGKISYPDGPIVKELEVFEYEYTRTGVRYSAPEGYHDDCVCSLALANRKRTQPSVGDNILAYYELAAQERDQQKKLSN